MCCRFFIDEETINDIQRIAAKIDVHVNTQRNCTSQFALLCCEN